MPYVVLLRYLAIHTANSTLVRFVWLRKLRAIELMYARITNVVFIRVVDRAWSPSDSADIILVRNVLFEENYLAALLLRLDKFRSFVINIDALILIVSMTKWRDLSFVSSILVNTVITMQTMALFNCVRSIDAATLMNPVILLLFVLKREISRGSLNFA